MFRALGYGAVLLLSASVLAACGGSSSPVPSNVRQQVHDEYGGIGFIPTQVPGGYGFQELDAEGPAGFNMYFSRPSGEQIQFGVDVASCASNGGAMHTFEANGVAIRWSATEEDQQAWRCVTVNRKQVLIMSSRSVPGDDSLATSQQRQDADQMVALVAHAQLAR